MEWGDMKTVFKVGKAVIVRGADATQGVKLIAMVVVRGITIETSDVVVEVACCGGRHGMWGVGRWHGG